MKARYWAIIALSGVAFLALSLGILNVAYAEFNSTFLHSRPNAVVFNDPFLSLLLPSTVLALVGLMLMLAGSIGMIEIWLRD